MRDKERKGKPFTSSGGGGGGGIYHRASSLNVFSFTDYYTHLLDTVLQMLLCEKKIHSFFYGWSISL